MILNVFQKQREKNEDYEKAVSFFAIMFKKLSYTQFTLKFLHDIYQVWNISIQEASSPFEEDTNKTTKVRHSKIFLRIDNKKEKPQIVVELDPSVRALGVESFEKDVLTYELLHFILEPEKLGQGNTLECSSEPNARIDRYFFDRESIIENALQKCRHISNKNLDKDFSVMKASIETALQK